MLLYVVIGFTVGVGVFVLIPLTLYLAVSRHVDRQIERPRPRVEREAEDVAAQAWRQVG